MRSPNLSSLLAGGSLALVALTTAVSSCSSDDSTGSASGDLSAGCAINSDCTAPLVCAFQRCHTACETTRDCPDGQRCMASDRPFHVCQLAIEEKCSYNSDCPSGQLCGVDGNCRDQCAADRDCVLGQTCASGTCAEPTELDAGRLPVADAGLEASGQPCSFDSECPPELVCRAGLCAFECLGSADCKAGSDCVDHRCVPDVCGHAPGIDAGQPCQYTSQCPAPLVCRAGFCSCECLADRDCKAGLVCAGYACVSPSDAGKPDASDGGATDGSTSDAGADSSVVDAGTDSLAPDGSTQDSGAGPFAIATAQVTPMAMALSGTQLVWLDFNATVWAGQIDGTGVGQIGNYTTTTPADIATDGVNAYYAAGPAGEVWQQSVSGGTPTQIAAGQYGVQSILVAGGNVYWSTTGGDVASVPVGGGSVTTIASLLNGIAVHAMAADATMLYYAESGTGVGTGTIWWTPLGVVQPMQLLTGLFTPSQLVVDAANLYYVADWSTPDPMFQVVKTGGTPLQLTGNESHPKIASDGLNVYWTNASTGEVNKIPVGGGAITTLASGQTYPYSIAVDGTYVYWANQGTGADGAILRATK